MQLTKTFAIAATVAVSSCAALSPECRELWDLPSGEVCASNGRTYNNYCEVEYENAKTGNASLKVVHTGRCGANETAKANASAQASENVEVTAATVRSNTLENGPAALWAVATSALAAVTFAALI